MDDLDRPGANTRDDRRIRQKAGWTPAVFEGGAPLASGEAPAADFCASRPQALLSLQTRIGNRAVARLLADGRLGGAPGPMLARQTQHQTPPALRELVRDYAANHVSQQVGAGDCAALATEALRAVGARARQPSEHGHYVWGAPVPVAFVEGGDILQMRNYQAIIRNPVGDGRGGAAPGQ
jgi:hypothetical protein